LIKNKSQLFLKYAAARGKMYFITERSPRKPMLHFLNILSVSPWQKKKKKTT